MKSWWKNSLLAGGTGFNTSQDVTLQDTYMLHCLYGHYQLSKLASRDDKGELLSYFIIGGDRTKATWKVAVNITPPHTHDTRLPSDK